MLEYYFFWNDQVINNLLGWEACKYPWTEDMEDILICNWCCEALLWVYPVFIYYIVFLNALICYLHSSGRYKYYVYPIDETLLCQTSDSTIQDCLLKTRNQFANAENEHNKKVARIRIHVELWMERLKNWHFLIDQFL